MAQSKIGLKFDGWTEYMAKLDEVGGKEAMKMGVDGALKQSKAYVNQQLEKVTQKQYLPAKGKYSKGRAKKSLSKDMSVDWDGLTAETDVGFDLSNGGLHTIFLMYGTPRMKPARGLKTAIYGVKTKKETAKIQQETITKTIKRIVGG